MKIAIIGTGQMATSLTAVLGKKNEITIYARDEKEAKDLAGKYQQSAKDLNDEIEEEIVILAIPYDSIIPFLNEHSNMLENKVLVDISNPMNWQTMELREGEGALKTAKSLPQGAKLVKAFNTIPAPILEKGEIEGKPVDVFIAGDDENAKEQLAEIINSSGLRTIDIGPLTHSYHAEVLLMVNSIAGFKVGNGKPVSIKILP